MRQTSARSPPQLIRLQYAADGRRTRRWLRRAIAALMLLLGAGASAVYFRKPVWAQGQLLYWQRQCMTYEEAPDHIAYMQVGNTAPAREKGALAALGQHAGYALYVPRSIEFGPGCLIDFDRLSAPESPSAFTGYREPCLFLHQRRSPIGHDRLVCVDFEFDAMRSHGILGVYEMRSDVIGPATVFTKPNLIPRYPSSRTISYIPDGGTGFIRFFTGRPDPADQSHFTIDFEVGGVYEEVGADAPASEKAASAARLSRSGYSGSVGSVQFLPDALNRFDPTFGPPAFNRWFQLACLFLHRRRSPAGHYRLVRVDFSSSLCLGSGGTFTTFCTLGGTSTKPASAVRKPHEFTPGSGALDVRWDTDMRLNNRSFFRFYTGRPDPADQSHFTIDYEVGNAVNWSISSDPAPTPTVIHGTIDGWLRDDETILLKPRGGKVTGNTWSLNDPLE